MNTTQIKNDIISTATSHVFEAIQNLSSPITTDTDEDQLSELICSALEHYQFDGVITYYECFLIVGSSDFPEAEQTDFSGCTNSLECLTREGNDIAFNAYNDAIDEEVSEAVERIMAIIEKATELGYDGQFQVSGSSIYGWEAHNYETNCGICIWSDEQCEGCYNPSLLEGELWAIEGTWNGLTIGACWTPADV